VTTVGLIGATATDVSEGLTTVMIVDVTTVVALRVALT
jgi:hypothetical protein